MKPYILNLLIVYTILTGYFYSNLKYFVLELFTKGETKIYSEDQYQIILQDIVGRFGSALLSCRFCMSVWLHGIVSIPLAFIFTDYWMLLCSPLILPGVHHVAHSVFEALLRDPNMPVQLRQNRF